MTRRTRILFGLAVAGLLASCTNPSAGSGGGGAVAAGTRSPTVKSPSPSPASTLLPGMPPPLNPKDVYAADRPGQLSPVVRADPSLIYVPSGTTNTVYVIDPATYRVVNTLPVGGLPQHVVPSWDLRTLWVNNNNGNSLTPIDPRTGRTGQSIPVRDPYNLYFTPNGRYALVMAEALRRIDYRDPRTMRLLRSVQVPCSGVNHADFAVDGRSFIATCEFSGQLLRVETATGRILGVQRLPGDPMPMPQDVKLSPDGRVFYVADMQTSGLWEIDARTFRRIGFLPTGAGAHGLYVSRDSRYLYVANRGEGSISLVSFATRKVVRTWRIPGGGSPDMGGVSADGKVLWLSGRYNAEVYAIDVVNWRLLAKIPVGGEPHGLAVFPQPGRYSLGHTGIFR